MNFKLNRTDKLFFVGFVVWLVCTALFFSNTPQIDPPAAEFCAEELTQRVLTASGTFEVSTHCVRKEPYILPGE